MGGGGAWASPNIVSSECRVFSRWGGGGGVIKHSQSVRKEGLPNRASGEC